MSGLVRLTQHVAHQPVLRQVEIAIDFRAAVMRMRREGIPHASLVQLSEAHDKLTALNPADADVLVDGPAIGLLRRPIAPRQPRGPHWCRRTPPDRAGTDQLRGISLAAHPRSFAGTNRSQQLELSSFLAFYLTLRNLHLQRRLQSGNEILYIAIPSPAVLEIQPLAPSGTGVIDERFTGFQFAQHERVAVSLLKLAAAGGGPNEADGDEAGAVAFAEFFPDARPVVFVRDEAGCGVNEQARRHGNRLIAGVVAAFKAIEVRAQIKRHAFDL